MIAVAKTIRSVFGAGAMPVHHLRQIGHLLSGNAASSVLMLVSVGIAARALTTEKFGVFVLVLTFVRLVERIARFESWQPLIKFASELEAAGDMRQLSRLHLYGLMLDVAAAATAAAAAVLIAGFFAPMVGLSDAYFELVAIYSVATLCNVTGMPTAALRLAGRFRTIAYVQLPGQVLRIGFALMCWHYGLGVKSFLVAWAAAQVLGSALFLHRGFAALRAEGVPNPLRASPRHLRRDFPGFLSFASSTNLSMTMRTLTQEADTLLVGGLAGPTQAGFYHLAKRLAKLAQQVGAQAQAVLYPDMARLWTRKDRAALRALTGRVQLALGGIGIAVLLVAVVAGEAFVTTAVGSNYAAVGPLLIAQIVSVIFIMHAAPSRSVLLSMGRPQLVLVVVAFGTALFFAGALLLIPHLGAMGASLAQILFAAFVALWMDVAWRAGLKRAPDPIAPRRTGPP
ncbi:lipopolysaccharide biosynthesis protein [Stakelama saccharophila]|uniref:Lipopolysaccharide biosynthesis protein n=1 Tax=Stakelama saccharophila TaxID=3075605 RepID=A0ABZ0BBI3_9SPHN|nr:lipopolysaccharide biosynthesis protein [Stakelama sp. W311]WNO54203.1 lipopolysaccharide biosynthesis protein [Stakelama sp. W311]